MLMMPMLCTQDTCAAHDDQIQFHTYFYIVKNIFTMVLSPRQWLHKSPASAEFKTVAILCGNRAIDIVCKFVKTFICHMHFWDCMRTWLPCVAIIMCEISTHFARHIWTPSENLAQKRQRTVPNIHTCMAPICANPQQVRTLSIGPHEIETACKLRL